MTDRSTSTSSTSGGVSSKLSIQVFPSTYTQPTKPPSPPSPIRFISATANYIFSLRSSGFSAPAALQSLRDLIMDSLGGIVFVPMKYMFDHSLPELPSDTVDPPELPSNVDNVKTVPEDLITKVINGCISEGLIVDGCWKGFPQDPKTRYHDGGKDNSENQIYKEFGIIWNKIVDVAKSILPKDSSGNSPEPIVRFRSVPNVQGTGERESPGVMPDAILELVKSSMIEALAAKQRNSEGYCICDAACPIEVKPVDSDEMRLDNVSKLTHHANRYFADDLRRRAVYGLEIENTDFRVLTYTRTGVIASQHFDWTKDLASLIRVILSLSFSSEEELGYDPNIRRVEAQVPPPTNPDEKENEAEKESNRRSLRLSEKDQIDYHATKKKLKTEADAEVTYEIIVDGRTWVTVGECLSDYRADFFVGRATRVFQVYEKGDTLKTLHVLKMYNIPALVLKAQLAEGNILIEINDKAAQNGCSKYFPTIVCHGLPPIRRKDGIHKDSSNLFLRTPVEALGFYPGVRAVKFSSSGKTIGGNRLHSRGAAYTTPTPFTTGIPSSVTANVEEFMDYCFIRRFQYRMITAEVGASIQLLPNADEFFFAMGEATHALCWLHIMGFLHRDLSVNNILYMRLPALLATAENKGLRIILNDYDSARRIVELSTSKALRTGTPEFLSNELILGFYIFNSISASYIDAFRKETPEDLSSSPIVLDEEIIHEISEEDNEAIPHPNFLHEAESLLWIAFWFLCHSIPENYTQTQDQNKHQAMLKDWIFRQGDASRINSRRLACFLRGTTLRSYFSMLPPQFHSLFNAFNRLRRHLLTTYMEIELQSSFSGPNSYVGRRGETTFYSILADCFQSCCSVMKEPGHEWPTTKVSRFVALRSNNADNKPAVEKVDLTEPAQADILQRPRGSSTSAGSSFGTSLGTSVGSSFGTSFGSFGSSFSSSFGTNIGSVSSAGSSSNADHT